MEPSTVDASIPLKALCCLLVMFVGGPLLILLSRVGQKKSGPGPRGDATRADLRVGDQLGDDHEGQ